MTEKSDTLAIPLASSPNSDSFLSAVGSLESSSNLPSSQEIVDPGKAKNSEETSPTTSNEYSDMGWDIKAKPYQPNGNSPVDEEDDDDDYGDDDDEDYANLVAEFEIGSGGLPQVYPDDIYRELEFEGLQPLQLFTPDQLLEDVKAVILSLAMCNLQKKGSQTSVDQMMITYNEVTNKNWEAKDSYFETFVDMVMENIVRDPTLTELVRQDKANFFRLDIFKDIIQYDMTTGDIIATPTTKDLQNLQSEIQRSLVFTEKRRDGHQAKKDQEMDTASYKLNIMHGCNFLNVLIRITAKEKMQEKVSWNSVRDVYDKMSTVNASPIHKGLYDRFKDILPLSEHPLFNSKAVKALFGRSKVIQALANPIFSDKIGYEEDGKNLVVFVKDIKCYSAEDIAVLENLVEEEKKRDQQKQPAKRKSSPKTVKTEYVERIQLEDSEYYQKHTMTQNNQPSPPVVENSRQQVVTETVSGTRGSPSAVQDEQVPPPRQPTPPSVSPPHESSPESVANTVREVEQQASPVPKQSSPPIRQQDTKKNTGYQRPAFKIAKKKKEKPEFTDEEDAADDEDEEEDDELILEKKPTLPPPRNVGEARLRFFEKPQTTTVDSPETYDPWTQPLKSGQKSAAPIPAKVEVKATVKPLVFAEADEPEHKTAIAPPETVTEKKERIEQFCETRPPLTESPVKAPTAELPTTDDDLDSDVGSAHRAPILPEGMNMEGPLLPRAQMPHELHPTHAKEKEEAMRRQREKMDALRAIEDANKKKLPGLDSLSKFARDPEDADEERIAEERRRKKREQEKQAELARNEAAKREAEKRRAGELEELKRRQLAEEEERNRKLEEVRQSLERQERERIAEEFEREQIERLEVELQERRRHERMRMEQAADDEKRAVEEQREMDRQRKAQLEKERKPSPKFGQSGSAFKNTRRTRGSEEGEPEQRNTGRNPEYSSPNQNYAPSFPTSQDNLIGRPISPRNSGNNSRQSQHNQRGSNYTPPRSNAGNYTGPPEADLSGRNSRDYYPQDNYNRGPPPPPPHSQREYDRNPPYERSRHDSAFDQGGYQLPRRGGPLPPNRPPSSYSNPMYSQGLQGPPRQYPQPPEPSFSRTSSTAPSEYSYQQRSQGPPGPPGPPRPRLNDREDFNQNMLVDEIVRSEVNHQRSTPHKLSSQDQFLNFIAHYVYAYREDHGKLKWSNMRQGLAAPLNQPELIFYNTHWMNVVNRELEHVSVMHNQKSGDYVFNWEP